MKITMQCHFYRSGDYLTIWNGDKLDRTSRVLRVIDSNTVIIGSPRWYHLLYWAIRDALKKLFSL